MRAGGIPILLPLTDDTNVLRQLYSQLSGICFAGGNDLHPHLYNEESVTHVSDYSLLRDKTEHSLLTWTLKDRKPLFAICRGMQFLNVIRGGSLIQDIDKQLPNMLDHDASTKLKTLVDLSHTLRIEPTSKLASIIGAEDIGANAHHHQAIRKLGSNIAATAWASDKIVEAIELIDHPYAIGIQAHPESLTIVEPRWALLFTSFVNAAQKYVICK